MLFFFIYFWKCLKIFNGNDKVIGGKFIILLKLIRILDKICEIVVVRCWIIGNVSLWYLRGVNK